jgi:hypothetical protein
MGMLQSKKRSSFCACELSSSVIDDIGCVSPEQPTKTSHKRLRQHLSHFIKGSAARTMWSFSILFPWWRQVGYKSAGAVVLKVKEASAPYNNKINSHFLQQLKLRIGWDLCMPKARMSLTIYHMSAPTSIRAAKIFLEKTLSNLGNLACRRRNG